MNPFLPALIAIALCACTKPPRPPTEPIPPAPPTPIEKEAPLPESDESLLSIEPPSWTIFFEMNSSTLTRTAKAADVVKHLQQTDHLVNITGHASDEGTAEYNLALGERRAATVSDYLVAFGIARARIRIKSYGEEAPVTLDPLKKHLNRRVEIALEELK